MPMDKKKKHNNTCSRCGKAVYFAERKTSLGRDWHPNCLRCLECDKILSPGQHAEHKGMPYCHKPCYGALFGPQMFGYGSNVCSPANFRKSGDLDNSSHNSSIDDGMTCIYKSHGTSPGPIKLQKGHDLETPPRSVQKRHSSGSIETYSSGYHSNSGNSSLTGSNTNLDTVSENGNDSGLKCVYQSNGSRKKSTVTRSHSDVGKFSPPPKNPSQIKGPELFKRVQSFNEHHEYKRGQTLVFTETDGNVGVQGPLRIYWGLKKPIMLKQYDDMPSKPIQKRYSSIITDNSRDLNTLPELHREPQSESPHSDRLAPPSGGGFDDSVLSSPNADVVMRRAANIKKSNTVAYRGDRPNKWKRASINGHMYNYDTSVFTPVLGSCTSVTVNNKMTVSQVVKALLDKFKVENQQDEYNLCIIPEQEEERVLKDSDIPLLERLILGPSDSVKIYIRDRPMPHPTRTAMHIPDDLSPTTETPRDDIALPEEVEALLEIPEPVLRGLLDKFKRDEEQDIRRLKAKYERIRKRVQQIITEKKENISRC